MAPAGNFEGDAALDSALMVGPAQVQSSSRFLSWRRMRVQRSQSRGSLAGALLLLQERAAPVIWYTAKLPLETQEVSADADNEAKMIQSPLPRTHERQFLRCSTESPENSSADAAKAAEAPQFSARRALGRCNRRTEKRSTRVHRIGGWGPCISLCSQQS